MLKARPITIRALALGAAVVMMLGGHAGAPRDREIVQVGVSPAIASGAPVAGNTNGIAMAPSGSWCGREPLGSVTVFVDDAGDSVAIGFRGSVVERRSADALGLERIEIRDTAGRKRTLVFRSPGGRLPLHEGRVYGFHVEFEGEAPHACALVVSDRRGVCLIAVSDIRPGANVLKGGVPGFRVALAPHRCPTRPHDECYEAIYNTTLEVVRGKTTMRLHHGETGRSGDWRVRCLTAQELVYSTHCSDAAVPGVSYLIERAR